MNLGQYELFEWIRLHNEWCVYQFIAYCPWWPAMLSPWTVCMADALNTLQQVKVLGCGLNSVILLCWLDKLSPIIGPVHSWEHTAWLLIGEQNWSTGNALTVQFPKGHHYDRFSQDVNPWSSDHRLRILTNSGTVASVYFLTHTHTL